MPRIPESEIERIKKETDLTALVRSRGVELKKHGERNLIGRCPFHDDHDPSFVLTPGKGLFHCLGCGAAGNAIQFVEKFDGLSFRHAFELLAEGGSAAFAAPTDHPVKKASVRRLDNPFDPKASDSELMSQVIDYYHERLLQTPAALDFLKKHGIYDEAMIKHFKLGLADRSLGLRLPKKNRAEGKAIRERLEKLGIYRASGHEHFNGSLVFPIFKDGHVVEIYGRKIGKQKSGINHLYLPGPHEGIWNPDAFESREVILCESIIDALSFWVTGCEPHGHFRNVTAAYGCGGFTDELKQAFIEHKTQKVFIAYDRDWAGDEAAERVANMLSPYGIECCRIQFPHGQDANEYIRKTKPPDKALDLLMRSAHWMGAEAPETSSRAPSSLVAIAAKEKTSHPVDPVHPVQKTFPPVGEVEAKGDDWFITLGDRVYRVRGLQKNGSLEVLKINLRAGRGEALFLDQIDLYQARQRESYAKQAAAELRVEPEMIKRDLGKLILKLETLQEERLIEALKPKSPEAQLCEKERAEALDLLKDPKLLDRILANFDRCGLVGEATNKLAGYVATVSRKLDRPLAVIIQSTSAAGKSMMMESVLSFLPEEEQIKYSAMTGQSLYYLGESDLKHKVLAIVEEEGAEKASYALKLLQSEGELTIASTGKDPNTGRMETQEYHVEGPVMIFLTTTAIEIDEELLNRCLVLTVDETKEQTEAIHRLQRESETFDGLKRKVARKKLLTIHRNAQRLLRPLYVVNPYAPQLTFLSHSTRTRRDHMKYLTLIQSIALLHQHQRPLKERDGIEFIEVERSDIEAAGRIAKEVLSRSLDELPPQTRRLLNLLAAWVREKCACSGEEKMDPSSAWFTRRQVRELTKWSNSQVKVHLDRLEEMEYILRRRGSFGVAFEYELACDPDAPSLPGIGLIETGTLKLRPVPCGS